MQAVIFDLDGTLIDSAPDIQNCANILLSNHGYDLISLKAACSFIGNGIPKFIERMMRYSKIEFSEQLHKSLVDEFSKIYIKNPTEKTVIYPNVVKALIQLQAQGFTLGICTNKSYANTKLIIKELMLEQYFNSVICGDSLPTSKPNPEMLIACVNELKAENAIFVGDSEVDADTAKAAQIPFILYTKGYLKAPIEELTFAASFDEYKNLQQIIKNI